MSLTYSSFVSSYSNMLVVPSMDTRFVAYLPNAIDYAEQRLYRELQLLSTQVTDTGTLSLNTRTFNLPSSLGTYVVTERVNVITPASTTNPELGTRNPLTPCSKEMLDVLWPSATGSTVPVYFAMRTQSSIIVGPFPDQTYTVEVIGTQRPAPLSASNVTTLLSVYFPDLFLTAALIFGAGALKNFGAAQGPDDAASGVTWESQYNKLLQSAQTEEAMKKFTSAGWSSQAPAPLATPPRT
jgi:hypothetical protein